MLTATVPRGGGGPDEDCITETGGVARLLDAGTSAGATARSVLPCSSDPDLWFADTPGELERAKQLCATCPVRTQCLAGAVSRGEPWGVWGGEIFENGSIIPRKRPRGRPRKNDVGPDGRGQAHPANRAA